jgi:hypothetical protein
MSKITDTAAEKLEAQINAIIEQLWALGQQHGLRAGMNIGSHESTRGFTEEYRGLVAGLQVWKLVVAAREQHKPQGAEFVLGAMSIQEHYLGMWAHARSLESRIQAAISLSALSRRARRAA